MGPKHNIVDVEPKYVYIAGPISKGDTLANIRNGIEVGNELIKLGFVPYTPHLDFIAYMFYPETREYETTLAQDFAWIERCDALLRIPGESAGADREYFFAKRHGLPIYYSIAELVHARQLNTAHRAQERQREIAV